MAKQGNLPDPDTAGVALNLTEKQAKFVAEFLIDLNATQAAIRAGYSRKTADVQGPRLLAHVGVRDAIQAAQAKQLEKVAAEVGEIEITAESVKRRLALIAFQDIRKLHDAEGNLLPIHQLPDAVAPMVCGLEVIKKNAAAGDGVIDTVHKVKIADPLRALEMLAKHTGVLTEKVEHSGEMVIRWKDSEV